MSARERRAPLDSGEVPAADEGWSFELPRTTPAQRARALEIAKALEQEYPDAHCELNFSTAHELVVATILSAQATDVSVNKATPALFKAFPMPADYARSTPEEIEPYIRTIGLFRNKAKAIHAAMKDVHERFGDQVPRTMTELLTLRGVARKTANVVLGNAYGINVGFVVDTHVERLARRFALANREDTVAMVERKLMSLFPRASWCMMSHRLIFHGRRACKARGVRCEDHPICARFGTACECRESEKMLKPASKPGTEKAVSKSTVPKNKAPAPRKRGTGAS